MSFFDPNFNAVDDFTFLPLGLQDPVLSTGDTVESLLADFTNTASEGVPAEPFLPVIENPIGDASDTGAGSVEPVEDFEYLFSDVTPTPNDDPPADSSLPAMDNPVGDVPETGAGSEDPVQYLQSLLTDVANPPSNLRLAEPFQPAFSHHIGEVPDSRAAPVQPVIHQEPEPVIPQAASPVFADVQVSEPVLLFQCIEEILAHDQIPRFKCPSGDSTIPQTAAQKQEIVKKLIMAIRNNKNVVEKTTSSSFINRWADGATHYHASTIEKLAWRLTDATIKLHTHGWTEPVYDDDLPKNIAKTDKFSFAQRMGIITDLLGSSKRTCEDLLKGDKFWTVIGSPNILLSRTRVNAVSNARKGERIKVAAELEKTAKAEATKSNKRARDESEDDNSVAQSANSIANKRARMDEQAGSGQASAIVV